MTLLQPALAFDPEETLLSYSGCLSVLHTGCGMRRLLKDRYFNVEHFVSGRPDAVEALSAATGQTQDALMRTAVRVKQRGGEFRGEDTSKQFLSPRAARYCPSCLIEDGEQADWRFRLIWGFRHVQRCDKHG